MKNLNPIMGSHDLPEYISVISDTEDLKTAPTVKEGPAYLAFYSGNTYKKWKGYIEAATQFAGQKVTFISPSTKTRFHLTLYE